MKIKGLPIIKSNTTKLGRLVFDRFIKSEIIYNSRHKFQKKEIEKWIEQVLNEDISYAAVFYKIKEPEAYKLKSQMQYQVATHKLYGPGQHKLIKLRSAHERGCGADSNYVGVQYASEIKLSQIDLDKTWSELEPFIDIEQKSLMEFFGK